MHLPNFTNDQLTEFLIWFKNNERDLQNDPAFQQHGLALLGQYAEHPEFNSHIQSSVNELASDIETDKIEALPACAYLAGMVTGFMMARWYMETVIKVVQDNEYKNAPVHFEHDVLDPYRTSEPTNLEITAGDQAEFADKVQG